MAKDVIFETILKISRAILGKKIEDKEVLLKDLLELLDSSERDELLIQALKEITRINEELAKCTPTKLDILSEPTSNLNLTSRPRYCLNGAELYYIGDLVAKTKVELLKTPNLGRKSLQEIEEVLSLKGLTLGMKHPDWQRPKS